MQAVYIKGLNGLLATDLITIPISTRTLSFWVKLYDIGSTAGGFGISKYSSDNFETITLSESPNQGWFFGSSGLMKSGSANMPYISVVIPYTWHMVTAVYDTTYSMYINNKLLFSIPNAGYLQTFTDPYRFIIGPRIYVSWATAGYINGTVGDVMVWGRALNSSEITALFKSTSLVYNSTTSGSIEFNHYHHRHHRHHHHHHHLHHHHHT